MTKKEFNLVLAGLRGTGLAEFRNALYEDTVKITAQEINECFNPPPYSIGFIFCEHNKARFRIPNNGLRAFCELLLATGWEHEIK